MRVAHMGTKESSTRKHHVPELAPRCHAKTCPILKKVIQHSMYDRSVSDEKVWKNSRLDLQRQQRQHGMDVGRWRW